MILIKTALLNGACPWVRPLQKFVELKCTELEFNLPINPAWCPLW